MEWRRAVRKVFAIALNDYQLVVLTKSFVLSLVLPIFLYGGMFALSFLIKDRTDLRERALLVVDHTGALAAPLAEAAEARNQSDAVLREGKQIAPRFRLIPHDPADLSGDALLADLAARTRAEDLFAFLIIGPGFLDPQADADSAFAAYYSNSPAYLDLPNWLSSNLRRITEQQRFAAAGFDLAQVRTLLEVASVERFTLPSVDANGNLIPPRAENEAATFLIPIGLVLLMFFSIQMATPILLNSVIEEKMQRIAEVLLSAVTSLQLLAGKIIAGTAIGLTFSMVYLVSLGLSLNAFAATGWVPPHVYLWFLVFLLLGLLTFGSLFAAVSSACQDIKDTQNLAGGVVLLLVIPMIVGSTMIVAPDSGFARVMSLIPPLSPITMMVRIAIAPGPALWEILLAVALNALFAFFAMWAASRIFRIGMLSQGKAPTFRELVTWIWRD